VKRVAQEILFQECPLCGQSPVTYYDEGVYRCPHCGLTLKNRTLLGLFRKGRFTVTSLALPPGRLKVVLGNVYTDQQLAEIAGGALELIRPVRTMLAQIILEQLKETCYLQVNGLQRGHGAPLSSSSFRPVQLVSRSGMSWQDQGNLFCTQQRLVFPSDSFTFIRLDRKLAAVQAFTNGVAVQRTGEDYATYFVGCWPHEAALVAACVLGKLPQLRQAAPELIEHK
jgi:hypothetical protein